jgi:hypothetical protein
MARNGIRFQHGVLLGEFIDTCGIVANCGQCWSAPARRNQSSTSSLAVRSSTGVSVTNPPLEYGYSAAQINVTSPRVTLTYPAVTAPVGRPLTVSPAVIRLTGTRVYSLVSGPLPQGLTLDPATGVITGGADRSAGKLPGLG